MLKIDLSVDGMGAKMSNNVGTSWSNLLALGGTEVDDVGHLLSPENKQAASNTEIQALINDFVADLDPFDQRVLHLRIRENLNKEEIAQRLDSTVQVVEEREVSIRANLRAYFRNAGILPRGPVRKADPIPE